MLLNASSMGQESFKMKLFILISALLALVSAAPLKNNTKVGNTDKAHYNPGDVDDECVIEDNLLPYKGNACNHETLEVGVQAIDAHLKITA